MSDLSNPYDANIASTVLTLKSKSVLCSTLKPRVVELSIFLELVLSRPVVLVLSFTHILGPSLDLKRMLTVVADVHLPASDHCLDLTDRKLAMRKTVFFNSAVCCCFTWKEEMTKGHFNLSLNPSLLPPPKIPLWDLQVGISHHFSLCPVVLLLSPLWSMADLRLDSTLEETRGRTKKHDSSLILLLLLLWLCFWIPAIGKTGKPGLQVPPQKFLDHSPYELRGDVSSNKDLVVQQFPYPVSLD